MDKKHERHPGMDTQFVWSDRLQQRTPNAIEFEPYLCQKKNMLVKHSNSNGIVRVRDSICGLHVFSLIKCRSDSMDFNPIGGRILCPVSWIAQIEWKCK